ncbi:MAG: FkbM family methyltransferase [Bryobacteraceae bacterium]
MSFIARWVLRPRVVSSDPDLAVWTSASRYLKNGWPRVHSGLKRLVSPLLSRDVSLRVPRRIGGRLVWTRPWLLREAAPEPHVIEWIRRTLPDKGTFFDIGAHYGWMAITAAHRAGPRGRVVAFEPSPVLLNVLSDHKRMNRLHQIEIVSSAVSNTDSGTVPLFLINGGLSSRNSLAIGPEDTPYIRPEDKLRIDVACTTVDSFVSASGVIPDVLKIDVEGAELLVLEGAKRLLEAHHPALILGVHPYWLPREHSVDQIFAFLNALGYRVEDQHVLPFDSSYLADYLCI